MEWKIKCLIKDCKLETKAGNIVDLIDNHRNNEGYFLCKYKHWGYIKKYFKLQGKNQEWHPYLLGKITLGKLNESYQPFAFLVSYAAEKPIKDIWFSYYKDQRNTGGRLKLGHGPGGPPVLAKGNLKLLLSALKDIGFIGNNDLNEIAS
jgi:hypothetical protein